MHEISRRYLRKFQEKERKKWKLPVSTLSSVRQKRGGVKVFRSLAETTSRREGCEGLEITRGKGRSVALCPLSGEFYSKCVCPFIDSIRQQSTSLILARSSRNASSKSVKWVSIYFPWSISARFARHRGECNVVHVMKLFVLHVIARQ